MLHGADYNPEQWLHNPAIFEQDLALMKEAHINVVSIGIFSWVTLEPEEGTFTFEWLDTVMDRLATEGISAFLATPTGARPAWMSQKYPEVLRVTAARQRNLHGERHNHCMTSPVYREKTALINTLLTERYKDHPALIGWHISNEYGGDCHCDNCQTAFREFLKDKYKTLEALNHAWWTTFWSHTYTDWEQIESPAPHGEKSVHGLALDWKRFVTSQTIDFYLHEVASIRQAGSDLLVTTNFMEAFEGLDYWQFAKYVDVISWDSYPTWHTPGKALETAVWTAFNHDLMRSLKGGQPFMLMESTPAQTNWQPVSKLKKPGMHELSSLQAIAHGSDTVQYFQWRQSRGSSEKFHGAVISHEGTNKTRVFQDVARLGSRLTELDDVVGTTVPAKAAIMFDWDNRWAIKESQGPRNQGMYYEETVREHYQILWERGIPTDVISPKHALHSYDLVIVPMLYMMTEQTASALEQYVKQGGTLVTTYWSGVVDERDLTYLGGRAKAFTRAIGVFPEEIDGLYEEERNLISGREGSAVEGAVKHLCEIASTTGADVLATYEEDFYAGHPAFTKHSYEHGTAFYVAARPEMDLLRKLYDVVLEEAEVKAAISVAIPSGVSVQKRSDGVHDYVFVMNLTEEPQELGFVPELDRTVVLKGYEAVVEKVSVKVSSEVTPLKGGQG
ncbi:beta-galactosidase [Paenalkalicoccus suaedae]|uniref:Beta-galactosidase n=2 Tax=Paenalkalicoccus suaedae TaxID=2592382 RepID=A0A859FKQ3_9BACI|nr:beta-galactosidase [Paenalkalicoccus suaedae]